MKRAWSDAYIQSVYNIDDNEMMSIHDKYKLSRKSTVTNSEFLHARRMFSLTWDAAAHSRFDVID